MESETIEIDYSRDDYQEQIRQRQIAGRARMFAQVEQIEQNGVLIIRPRADADDDTRSMFAVGSTPIRPNGVFYPPDGVQEIRHEIETRGMWAIVSKVRALATARVRSAPYPQHSNTLEIRVYGVRTLTNPREDGHDLEGRVSIAGKQYRAFTSSCMFEREDGSLVSVGTLYVCLRDA